MQRTIIGFLILGSLITAPALSIGAGAVYKNLLVENGDGYLGLVGDVYFKLLPFLGVRFGIAEVDLPEGETSYKFGVHTGANLFLAFPLEGMPISPYILFGLTYAGDRNKRLDLIGGGGFNLSLNPQFGIYVESAINYYSHENPAGIKSEGNPLYIGGGIKVKIPML
ncbi:hypothetical protein DRP53_09825 [candidate division WOR-3 bacterium]|uniref:Outer membrane protein beta-barrel domain-containing protein n=1 Tax=candidate division WOR-3 bacterium TaxID=2052148 RepID=A0A660SDH8_UNCW3|nr:MAG: hypothetical protein DRP53_09825 [candidate division WOR-3 bacterium]